MDAHVNGAVAAPTNARPLQKRCQSLDFGAAGKEFGFPQSGNTASSM